MKPLFSVYINNFEVMPKVRMTQRSKWSPRARKYLESQKALALLFKSCHMKAPIDVECEISFVVNRKGRRCDADNIIKALQDSLQYGQIIINDSLIQGYGESRVFYNTGKSNVLVELKEIKND